MVGIECSIRKFPNDTELGLLRRSEWCMRELCCHPEEPYCVGEMGSWGSHVVHQGEVQSPAAGEEQLSKQQCRSDQLGKQLCGKGPGSC